MAVKHINIAAANTQGISRKKALIEHLLSRDNISILAISEIKKAEFPTFRHYNAIHRRSDHPGRRGEVRGVALLRGRFTSRITLKR